MTWTTTGWRQQFQLTPVANWPTTTVRTFLLDPVNGNDANVGYSDGAGPYTPATQAKKTIAGLKNILPVNFAGRSFRIIMAAGTYTSGLDQLLGGATGMGVSCLVRGTATNTTAGCTAFDDSAADRIYQGWTTATGMNAPGYHPTGAPTTTSIQCLTASGGAPGFGAEPALPLGTRIRFDANTTTAALRNICRVIGSVSGTDTLGGFESALPAVPVASDTFYVEMGGIAVPAHTLSIDLVGISGTLQLCGITSTGAITLNGDIVVSGFKCLGFSNFAGRFSANTLFVEPTTGGTVPIGGCLRSDSTGQFQRGTSVTLAAYVSATTTAISGILQAPNPSNIFVSGGSVSLGPATSFGIVSGANVRVLAPGTGLANLVLSGNWQLGSAGTATSLTGAGAKPAIRIQQGPPSYVVFANAGVSGSTGNNDVGMDCSPASGWIFVLTTVPTVTGAAGDVRVAAPGGSQIITWAQAAAGFVDANGNRFIAAGASSLYQRGKFSGILHKVGSGTPVSTFASDYGSGQNGNQSYGNQYPGSVRLITKLRLVAPSGTAADSGLTATLYKNGVATAMTCTIAAAQAAGAQATDAAHPILFADGDTFDVLINGTSGTDCPFSAVLEGP